MRTVLVTGGSRGIGAAICRRFAAGGWRILAPDRAELDLSSPSSISAWLEQPAAREIDALVNNAAENIVREIPELAPEEWTRMLQINLTAPFELLRGLGPRMAARKWGRVVNVGSAYSFVSRERRTGYTSTKTGLLGLTRAAAVELAPQGILVNLIAPGFVETDMTRRNNTPAQVAALAERIPLQRLAHPDEVAELAFYLGSEANTYITGAAIPIDGGFLCQ